jgi:glucose-6-phosphate isomerase, archaeal
MNPLIDLSLLLAEFDPRTGTIGDEPCVQRRLADLRGCFHDVQAYERALEQGNALVYSVASFQPADGPGDLHCGLGVLQPGLVGDEYFLTKGHLHTWREAAEIYIGLSGEGVMLLEDEATRGSRMLPLQANSIVYVPGHTAHRTINTGDQPLAYLGIYPAGAGHDYHAIAKQDFDSVVLRCDGHPRLRSRT